MLINSLITPAHSAPISKNPSFKNRLPQEDKILHENRPSHRTHPYGGTLVWGTYTEPTLINPVLTTHTVSASLISLIFNSLVRVNSNGEIAPDLAESWEISSDQRQYTFYLKKGITFHDGVELTAEDVQFTYDLIMDPNTQSALRSHYELVEKFEALDKYTFKVILKKPFTPLLQKMTQYILPKHLLINEDIHTTPFNYNPIGTGPFQFKQWDESTHQIELQVNPHYFEGRPYLDKILVKTYKDNSGLWAALMRYEVDLVLFINQKDYAIIKDDANFKAERITGSMYYALLYNPRTSTFSDQEIRHAIAHGINREKLIHDLKEWGGVECSGPFHPDSIGFNPEVRPLEYNPIKAKMMLMHRGWQDRDGDGILDKYNQPLEMKILVDERNATHKKIGKLIRQQLAEIGVKVKLLIFKDENELTKEYLDKHRPHAWLRLFLGRGVTGYDTTRNWHSMSSQSWKLWKYKNTEVDALFEQGKIAQNKEKRIAIYKEIHKEIYNDQPACFLFFPVFYSSINTKLQNTQGFFNLHMPTYTLKDWYINEN